jgi:hypothetical protein
VDVVSTTDKDEDFGPVVLSLLASDPRIMPQLEHDAAASVGSVAAAAAASVRPVPPGAYVRCETQHLKLPGRVDVVSTTDKDEDFGPVVLSLLASDPRIMPPLERG